MRSPESVRRYRDVDNRKRRAARARRIPSRGPRASKKLRLIGHKGNCVQVTLTVLPSELERIDAEAVRLAMPRSEFLRNAAEHWIRSREQNEGAHGR